MDDLIHDEAEEVAQAEDVLRTHRQVDMRSGRDVTNEEVERYVKERYEDPALREAAQRDDGGGAQAGAPLRPCARPRPNRKPCQGGGPARGRRRAGASSAGPLPCAVTGMGPPAVQGCPQWR